MQLQPINGMPDYLMFREGYTKQKADEIKGADVKKTANELAEEQKQIFLKLLIKEIQYQNPLDPMGNSDFVAQLATFSTLEELGRISTVLEESKIATEQLNRGIQQSMVVNLFGKSAEAPTGYLELSESGGETTLSYMLEGPAETVSLDIFDEVGTLVRSLYADGTQNAGRHTIDWNGISYDGSDSLPGVYNFEVRATDASGEDVEAYGITEGIVSGIRYKDGQALVMLGNIPVPYSDINVIKASE